VKKLNLSRSPEKFGEISLCHILISIYLVKSQLVAKKTHILEGYPSVIKHGKPENPHS
jgi:hypothetical protein